MGDPVSPTGVEAPSVVVSDEQADRVIDVERWARLAEAVLADQGRAGELTLTFVDLDEITALNAEHMGQSGPTDVLSFPLDDDGDRFIDGQGRAIGPLLLGDVVVCPAVAAEQAGQHAGTFDDELALLVVHGVLHVLGHDHGEADERATMREIELALLSAHHWHGPAPIDFRHEQPE